MSLFLRGLLQSLRAFVMTKQPETFRDAFDAARLGVAVQNCNQPMTPFNSAQINVIKSPEANVFQSTLETLTALVTNMSTRLEKLEENIRLKPQQPSNQTQAICQVVSFALDVGFRGINAQIVMQFEIEMAVLLINIPICTKSER